MTEKELEQTAWNIYKEALKKVCLPDHVVASETKGGKLVFTIRLVSGRSGASMIRYCPETQIIKEKLLDGHELTSLTFIPETDRGVALKVACLMLENFHVDIVEACTRLHEIPILLATLMRQEAMLQIGQKANHPDLNIESIGNPKLLLEDFLNERKLRAKERVTTELEFARKLLRPANHLFAYFYENVALPKWERAVVFFKTVQSSLKWEQLVAIECEDLPRDLIKRLRNLDSYHHKSGTYRPAPAPLALEHAARLCGIPNDSLQLRALQKYLSKSRQWMKDNGKEIVDKEFTEYTRYNLEYVMQSYQMASQQGENPNTENFSFAQQLLAEKLSEHLPKTIEENAFNKISEPDENSFVH